MKVLIGLKCLWFYFFGKILSFFFYKREYIHSRYFVGRFNGVLNIGWKWTVEDGLSRILFGTNKGVPWPVSHKSTVTNPENIIFHPDDLHIFQTHGTYFQAIGAKIYIGKGSWIAPNVGLITANHDMYNLELHTEGKDIKLGENNWIGMNSVILPGVTLGNNTVVGAGSVVTKSFIEGNCVVAGNPAKIIKKL